MIGRLCVLVLLTLGAIPALASIDRCLNDYNCEQCRQMYGDPGAPCPPPTGGGSTGGGSSSCPYYMCGNATGQTQPSWGWCEATGSYTDCYIAYCRYVPCVGENCHPEWMVCSTCSSRSGNNVRTSECPRT